MTKYVLNSGGLRNNVPRAKYFFAEVVKGLGNSPRVLICYFAQPRENWEEKFEELKTTNLYPDDVHPIFELAFPDVFEQQIRDTDALYIYGGDDNLVQYWLSKYNLPDIWKGKVVATNSASTNALANSFWTCDWRKVMDGLNFLPIKVLPHYQSDYGKDDPRGPVDWESGLRELTQYGDTSLPVHALREGEFIVFEI